jgi:hypothetical protein
MKKVCILFIVLILSASCDKKVSYQNEVKRQNELSMYFRLAEQEQARFRNSDSLSRFLVNRFITEIARYRCRLIKNLRNLNIDISMRQGCVLEKVILMKNVKMVPLIISCTGPLL